VGDYTILVGGTQYLRPEDFRQADLLVPLTDRAGPLEFGQRYQVLAGCLQDYGGVPEYWREFLGQVIEELKSGKRILAFCVGSHGRTGTFLASLVALLESEEETPDPIAAARERHCHHAVETRAQAEAIFALRGKSLPEEYEQEFLVQNDLSEAKQPL
jgi:protein-tyrosine phosphatase